MSLYRYLKKQGNVTVIDMFTETIVFSENKFARIKKSPGFERGDGIAQIELYADDKRLASFIEYTEGDEYVVKVKWLFIDRLVDGDFKLCWCVTEPDKSNNDVDAEFYCEDVYKGQKYVVSSIDALTNKL